MLLFFGGSGGCKYVKNLKLYSNCSGELTTLAGQSGDNILQNTLITQDSQTMHCAVEN